MAVMLCLTSSWSSRAIAALNPDSTRHPVMVWPAQLSDTVTGAVARIHPAKDGSNDIENFDACRRSYGYNRGPEGQCLVPVAAHRYVVSLRLLKSGNVVASYADGWYVAVDGTSVIAPVPEEAIENAITPFTLDVAAMDVHLYSHIASGNAGSAFSVFPVQNVVGGFGVVGSVRYRSLAVEVK